MNKAYHRDTKVTEAIEKTCLSVRGGAFQLLRGVRTFLIHFRSYVELTRVWYKSLSVGGLQICIHD